MTTPRLRMTAIVPFTVGEEDIEEGDLLLLTPAEAAVMIARGLVVPKEAFIDPVLIHDAPDALQ